MKKSKTKEDINYSRKIKTFFITFFVFSILISGIVFSQDEQEEFSSNSFLANKNSINNPTINLSSIDTTPTREEIIIEKQDIDFSTHYRNNNELDKGKINIVQEGIDGEKKTIIKKMFKGEELLSETVVSEEKVKNPRDKIVEIGTKEKEIVKKKSTTSSPSNGKNGLSFSINLYKPSGFTYEQFVKALSGNSNDKNKIIENNAQYFYYAEQQYGINGMFLAAVAIHESGWGTSKISLDKKNLFGYGAYDGSAYQSAWSFESYAEGIDLLARVFTKYYLSESGSHYNGKTLEAVNKKYATDKAWCTKVYAHMKTLYGKI